MGMETQEIYIFNETKQNDVYLNSIISTDSVSHKNMFNIKLDKESKYTNLNNNSTENIYIRKNKIYDVFKRLFDIFSSLLAIICLSPIMLVFSLIIKCTSKGPVLFKDKRIGKNGKEIFLFKFRSMYIDAESRIKDYLTEEQYNTWLVERKIDKDPRITKIGNFMRKTSIDEIPQLFNILNGSMSVIGPRAITEKEWETNFSKNQKDALLSIKPGLSGYWAAYARSNATFESGERQKLELQYLSKRSFFFDIKLIFVTIFAVIHHKGAK